MEKDWDRIYKEGAHWEEKPTKHTLSLIKYIKKEDKILEIGCGSGRDLLFLKSKGFDIKGIDISKEALNKLKDKAKKANLKVDVEYSDIESLPFKDNSFDVVYSINTLHFVNIPKAIEEIHRVIKKQGIVYWSIILKTKYLERKAKTKEILANDILKLLDKFEIIEKNEFSKLDDVKDDKHIHYFLRLILRKTS